MSKINRSHSTYIDKAGKVLSFLNSNPLVKKISLGIICPKRPPAKSHGPYKLTITSTHILLEVNSKAANQEIHIFSDNRAKREGRNITVFVSFKR
jgi:hypothetical protein